MGDGAWAHGWDSRAWGASTRAGVASQESAKAGRRRWADLGAGAEVCMGLADWWDDDSKESAKKFTKSR